MPRAPDLVHDSKLETTFIGHETHHVAYKSIVSTQQRKIKVEELWSRRKKIGDGTYGRVWLESCSEGPKKGDLRAVKEIPKIQANSAVTDYASELEAITKFSQTKASLRPTRHPYPTLVHVLNSRQYMHCFVQSFGWYESETSVYIAMEYMEHGDLQVRLTQPYPETEVQSIASQLLEGLQFMHDNGFTHRDLKPSNILVLHPSPEWWVKIGDFGVSKRVEEGLTSLRTMVGTRGYLAPEIIGLFPITDWPADQQERESYTSAVDIWALGAICFKLIANRSAFSTPRELFNYVARGYGFPRAPLRESNAGDDCISFIAMAMSPSAVNRPSASDGLKCAWMKFEAKETSIGQSQFKEEQEDASSLPGSQNFEATAEWSTLSDSTTMSPTSRARKLHTTRSSSRAEYKSVVSNIYPVAKKAPTSSAFTELRKIIEDARAPTPPPIVQSWQPIRQPISPQNSSQGWQTVFKAFSSDTETRKFRDRYRQDSQYPLQKDASDDVEYDANSELSSEGSSYGDDYDDYEGPLTGLSPLPS